MNDILEKFALLLIAIASFLYIAGWVGAFREPQTPSPQQCWCSGYMPWNCNKNLDCSPRQ